MKKIFFAFLTMTILFGSNKAMAQDPNFVIPKNDDVTLVAKDGTKIIASDVYSMSSKLRRSIKLFDAKTGSLIGEAFINLESDNVKENMYNKLTSAPGSFSGTLTGEIDGQNVYRKSISNGVAAKGELINEGLDVAAGGGPGPVYNPSLTCTVGHVHDCVSYNIEGMNWVEYAFCLISAPLCYAGEWSSCAWEVCHNHMQYTNPVN